MHTTEVLPDSSGISWLYDLLLSQHITTPVPTEDLEPDPHLDGALGEEELEDPHGEKDPPSSWEGGENNILWLLNRVGTTHVPSEQEVPYLVWQVRAAQEASQKLASATGFPAPLWRLWARSRLLERPFSPSPPPPTRETLPLVEALLAGEGAYLTMVEGNLKLVVHVAKRYVREGLHLNDLLGYGALGLMTAVDRYDPTRGHRFSTYAYHWVRKWVSRALWEQADGFRTRPLSLDAPLEAPGVEGEIRYGDILSWQGLTGKGGPEEEATARLERERVRRALRSLPWPQALVLILRSNLLGHRPLSNHQIAYILGIPEERVALLARRGKEALTKLLSP